MKFKAFRSVEYVVKMGERKIHTGLCQRNLLENVQLEDHDGSYGGRVRPRAVSTGELRY